MSEKKKKNRTGIEWFAEELLEGKEKAILAILQSNICPFTECPFGHTEDHCDLEEAEECWSITEEEIERAEIEALEELFADHNLQEEEENKNKNNNNLN